MRNNCKPTLEVLHRLAVGMSMYAMAGPNRRRRVVVFVCLGLATVVLAVTAISLALGTSAVPCHGLSCPSGGGAASSSGSSAWPAITGVAAIIGAVGTLLQGIAAFRKAPAVQVQPAGQAPESKSR